MNAPIHEPGIYFGLDAEAYHADPALGSSALKAIAADPYDWQYKRLHGEDKDTAALIWGAALHVRTLEGRTAFLHRYARAPNKADYPGALDTMDDLRRHAKSMGLRGGKTKAELIAMIREHDTDVLIWEEIVASHAERNRGKIVLADHIFGEIEQAAAWMQADPKLAPVMSGGQIIAGASEVSIFYNDRGVRLKIRIDRLLQHGLIDIKSFRPSVGWTTNPRVVNKVLGRVIAQYRYDLQAADYIRGFECARPLFGQGRVFGGSDLDHELLKAAMACEDLKWIWVLIKNSGAPEPFVREFPLSLTTFKAGMIEVEDAIETYRRLHDEFGDDVDWTPRHPADAFEDEDFPAYMGM